MPLTGPGTFSIFFGSGQDGDVLLTGTLFLTRDMHFDHLIMSGTQFETPRLNTNSCRLFVRSKLIWMTSGSIRCDGTSGSDGGNPTGSAGLPGYTPRPPLRIVTGNALTFGDRLYNTTASYSASFLTYGIGGIASGSVDLSGTTLAPGAAFQPNASLGIFFGGSGGNGGSTPSGSGGVGANLSALSEVGSFTTASVDYASAVLGYMIGAATSSTDAAGWTNGIIVPIGAGGGGGGAAGHNNSNRVGPGGGGGGGVLLVAAAEIVCGLSSTFVTTGSRVTYVPGVTGTLAAVGGRGGSFGAVAGAAAAAGGGGGVVFLVTAKRPIITGSFGLMSASNGGQGFLIIDVSGGFPGVKGAGVAATGSATSGSAGRVFTLDVF